nr:MAG TPA: hypothetical protein [Caudoviricetes sp.]DAY72005.1 MAG TPA: hypothetical protein [Caudoviricetes sp.]DAY98711.1 MAG TPA: hypothetical protein [Caudoviricetes sp.]
MSLFCFYFVFIFSFFTNILKKLQFFLMNHS